MRKDIIELEWKAFKIDLVSFEEYLRANYPSYCGNNSHDKLELGFTEVLLDVDRQAIVDYYGAMIEADETAKCALGSRKSYDIKEAKLKEIKLGMVTKAPSKYTNIEKKINLGLELDNNDWNSLI